MLDPRRSIYWKQLFTLFAGIVLASLVVGVMYLVVGNRFEVHPQIKKSLIRETHVIAELISSRLKEPSSSLENILKEIHEKEYSNIRVFDLQGKELAACMIDKLNKTKKISFTSNTI